MSDRKAPIPRRSAAPKLEAQTRQRITESAVELHGTLGPARTSMSAVAEHAGVRRSTVYRHFPDEAALFGACSAHWAAAEPAARHQPLGSDRGSRTSACGRRSTSCTPTTAAPAAMIDNLLRDEPRCRWSPSTSPPTTSYLAMAAEILDARPRPARQRRASATRAAIGHALAFRTWQQLTEEGELGDAGSGRADAAAWSPRLAEEGRGLEAGRPSRLSAFFSRW